MQDQLVAGKYRLISKLGEGGMGSVWRAINTATQAEVAVKFIADALSDLPDARRRFELEARVGATLRHPNVAQVFDVVTDSALGACLIIELLRGQSLRDYLSGEGASSKRTLGLSEVCALLVPIMDGLETAHQVSVGGQHGVVHRDVKPDNIFLSRDQRGETVPKLMDFGIARVREARTQHTAEGALIGTVGYMAPEQLHGMQSQIGPATDVYAIGVVAFECLAGQRPFQGAGTATQELARALEPDARLPALTQLRPDLAEAAELDEMFGKALAAQAADRFPSMRAFTEALVSVAGFDLDALLGKARLRRLETPSATAPTLLKPSEPFAEKYILKDLLGEGGMGSVYRASNTWTGADVAIKFVSSHVQGTESLAKRFELEAKVGARLNHPNVLKVLDVQRDPARGIGIVMELLEGESLESYLSRSGAADGSRRQLSLQETCRILVPVMHGLHAAHRLDLGGKVGVTHRDVKPANIFLSRDHHGDMVSKLMDFGIARIQEANSVGTQEGQMIGTPGYMSPEQAQGQQALMGPASDIWSMGVVLYQCLAAFRPFQRPEDPPGAFAVELARLITEQSWVPLREVRRDVPEAEAVDAVLARALAKEPSQRFADMNAFMTALAQAAGLEVDALLGRARVTQPQAPVVRASASRTLILMLVAGLCAAAAAFAFATNGGEPTAKPSEPADPAARDDPKPEPGPGAEQPTVAPDASPAPQPDLVKELLKDADRSVRVP